MIFSIQISLWLSGNQCAPHCEFCDWRAGMCVCRPTCLGLYWFPAHYHPGLWWENSKYIILFSVFTQNSLSHLDLYRDVVAILTHLLILYFNFYTDAVIEELALSPDGQIMVLGDSSGRLHILDTDSSQVIFSHVCTHFWTTYIYMYIYIHTSHVYVCTHFWSLFKNGFHDITQYIEKML